MESWIRKQVPSLETCKALKDAGYLQEGEDGFWWMKNQYSNWEVFYEIQKEWIKSDYVKAPTASDLIKEIPSEIRVGDTYYCYYEEHIYKPSENEKPYAASYRDMEHDEPSTMLKMVISNTEAEARAKILLWLCSKPEIKFL